MSSHSRLIFITKVLTQYGLDVQSSAAALVAATVTISFSAVIIIPSHVH